MSVFCSAAKNLRRVCDIKDFAGELRPPTLLYGRAEYVRIVAKESQNGLEDPEDRRSIGGHGNQHVRLRRPQISGSDSFTLNLKVDRRE